MWVDCETRRPRHIRAHDCCLFPGDSPARCSVLTKQATSPTYVNDSVDGRQFRVRIVGIVTVSASSTFQVSLYNGTSSTVTSDTLVSISASYTVTTASSVNFVFENNFLWDSVSSKLNGWFQSDVNNTFTGSVAITAITNLSVTQLQFIPAFTFGTSNAANQVVVKEFLFENV